MILNAVRASAAVRYILPCRQDVLSLSGKIARSQVGVREKTGHNDGKKVEQYLSSVGLKTGNPYCAAGQVWCFREALKRLDLGMEEMPILVSGLANAIFTDAKRRGSPAALIPCENDLIVWKEPYSMHGHIERVDSVLNARKGWIQTIGFNTGNGLSGSQREGNGVFLRKRNIYCRIGRMAVRGLIGFYFKKQR